MFCHFQCESVITVFIINEKMVKNYMYKFAWRYTCYFMKKSLAYVFILNTMTNLGPTNSRKAITINRHCKVWSVITWSILSKDTAWLAHEGEMAHSRGRDIGCLLSSSNFDLYSTPAPSQPVFEGESKKSDPRWRTGVYTKFSGRLYEEPFPWLIQKFLCILIFQIGQPGCQLNLSRCPKDKLGWIWRADDP